MNIIEKKWNEILNTVKVEHELSDVSFRTWLLPLKFHSFENDTLTILVPTEQMGLNYVKKKYSLPIKVSIAEETGIDCNIEFILPEQIKETPAESNTSGALMDDVMEKANLNVRYTFETFIVGKNNNFAHAASLAVAESPGEVYNPLFLYGGVGLGKTHLMHSIAHFILNKNPAAKVLYVTSESFTNELIESIRNGNNSIMRQFREKYRNIDVLLIDDIQFIIGKEATQEEFFHTFNELHTNKKQIIISSDRPPKEMETLEDRLKSRFEWGLIADIQAPDYETRMAILRKKAEMDHYQIDDDIIKYIADNIKSNIRELEGALTKVVAYGNLIKQNVTLDIAYEALKDIISPSEEKEVTPQLILNVVAEHFSINPNDIIGKKKNSEIVFPRQITMYLCRTMTDVPLKTIGSILGKRDHSTILHGCDKIKNEIDQNESTKNTVDTIIKKINPS